MPAETRTLGVPNALKLPVQSLCILLILVTFALQ